MTSGAEAREEERVYVAAEAATYKTPFRTDCIESKEDATSKCGRHAPGTRKTEKARPTRNGGMWGTAVEKSTPAPLVKHQGGACLRQAGTHQNARRQERLRH
jgi:hypothetical protein